jgi:hypothetical protein
MADEIKKIETENVKMKEKLVALTPKWVPLRFLPAFLTLSKSE